MSAGSIGFNAEVVNQAMRWILMKLLRAGRAAGSYEIWSDPGVYRPCSGHGFLRAAVQRKHWYEFFTEPKNALTKAVSRSCLSWMM